jgi:hypothetical protein
MTNEPDTTMGIIARVIGVILAWLGSLKLGDIQASVAILSGIAVLLYTVLQIVALWKRDFRQ